MRVTAFTAFSWSAVVALRNGTVMSPLVFACRHAPGVVLSPLTVSAVDAQCSDDMRKMESKAARICELASATATI